MKRIHKYILLAAVSSFIFIGTMANLIVIFAEKAGPLREVKTIYFKPGTSLKKISYKMKEEGVINSSQLFFILCKFYSLKHIIKAGEYEFTPYMTPNQAIDIMIQGKNVIHKMTIPEGLTNIQIATRLMQEQRLEGGINLPMYEGELLPETYYFSYGDKRQSIIDRMKENMKKTIDELWEKKDKTTPINSVEEAIILASIVEKETSKPEERARIAGIFVNRLKKKMKLQADPTVIYGITMGKADLGRSLTKIDLTTYNDYNTYMIEGLPPSPIANPGKMAIKAALNPLKTNELYFVSDGITGGHNFSSNLKLHNQYVKEYKSTVNNKKRIRASK